MPIFEYRCRACGAKYSRLLGMTADSADDGCPECGSSDGEKLVSRFRHGRTEDDRIDEIADRLEIMGEPESPAEMRQIVRDMGKAMDEDLSDEMEEMFESDMAGESEDDE